MQILTPKDPEWKQFCGKLNDAIHENGCDSMTLKNSDTILRRDYPQYDSDATLGYFREHNGFCDCEVLMNVDG